MLGRILKRKPSSFPSSSPPPRPQASPSPNGTIPNRNGRKLDVTFNDRYLQAAPQPTIMTQIWRYKQRENIRKAEYRRLPMEEKQRRYLESRPIKKKLLDWVGSKSRELVRAARTVDAWSGPPVRNNAYLRLSGQRHSSGQEVKYLGSGNAEAVVSDRAKKVMVWGMVTIMGGLMGWLAFGMTETTRNEGPAVNDDSAKLVDTGVSFLEENRDRKPGVYIWGSNRGDVTAPGAKVDFVKSATRLTYFDNRGLRDMALSTDLGVAVDEQGDVIQWGRAFSHTLVPEATLTGKNITNVKISGDNVICLSKSGSVYVLPASKTSLANGPKPAETTWIPFWSSTSEVSYTPLMLPEKITAIAAGDDHFLLLSASGKVFSAATTTDGNTFGQLGVESSPEASLLTPYPISTLPSDPVTAIAAGERHSLALTSHGEVYSWGSNAQGQLFQQFAKNNFSAPQPTLVPLQRLIPGLIKVVSIAAGGANSFIVANMNTSIELYASGSGMWGQLGSGVWNQIQHKPSRVKTLRNLSEWSDTLNRKVDIGIRYMSVGENHVAAVLDNDVSGGIGGRDVFIWGCGEAYQLGHGKRNNLNVPSPHNPIAIAEGRQGDTNAERFMLKPRRKVEVVTNDGRKKNVFCEETIVFGGGCSAVYEKIVS